MANNRIKKANRRSLEAKKTLGLTMLILGVFMFLFSCIPSFLDIGKFLLVF